MGTRQRLILLGAGGQGRVVADIALHTGLYREIGFLDDDQGVADTGLPFPLLGGFSEYGKWLGEADFAVAIGNNAVREALQDRLTAAGDTAAGACHNFYKFILFFAGTDAFQKLSGIS